MIRKLLLLLFFIIGCAAVVYVVLTNFDKWTQLDIIIAVSGVTIMLLVFLVSLNIFFGSSVLNDLEDANSRLSKENEEIKLGLTEAEAKIQTNERINDLAAGIQASATFEIAASEMLNKMAKDLELCQGVFYVQEKRDETSFYRPKGAYAYHKPIGDIDIPEIGVGLVGQCAKDRKMLVLDELPAGYIEVISGLGKSQPSFVVIIPLISEDEVVGVMELATLKTFTDNEIRYFEQMQNSLGFAVYLLSEKIRLSGANKLTA